MILMMMIIIIRNLFVLKYFVVLFKSKNSKKFTWICRYGGQPETTGRREGAENEVCSCQNKEGTFRSQEAGKMQTRSNAGFFSLLPMKGEHFLRSNPPLEAEKSIKQTFDDDDDGLLLLVNF